MVGRGEPWEEGGCTHSLREPLRLDLGICWRKKEMGVKVGGH